MIGVDPRGTTIMENKFRHFLINLYGLTFRQAAIIKQEMLARGAEAAVSWKVCSWDNSGPDDEYEALLTGTLRQYQEVIAKLRQQPFGLSEIASAIEASLTNYEREKFAPMVIKNKTYDFNSRTYLMGIINLTPDSFSNDGLYGVNLIERALRQATQMVADGADFLDLGAESTRPGFQRVDDAEEARRLLPVLKELVAAVNVPISVDTSKPAIAEKAVNLGAAFINDIWGLQSPEDPECRMAQIIGSSKIPVVVMHNRTKPAYQFLIKEIVESLSISMEIAARYGASAEQIIVDPGIGFGKSYADNIKTLQNMDQLKVLGRPILLGVSRKSVIGETLNLPAEERVEGTIAATVWGIATGGVDIIRVHDVKAISRAVKICDALNQK